MKIYKYQVIVGAYPTSVILPRGSKILSCGIQQEAEVVVWASIAEGAKADEWDSFEVYPVLTGHDRDVPADAVFLGTVQMRGLVVHLFVWKHPKGTV